MIFHDPDTLQFWINVFFAVAAVSVAFAFAALTVRIREQRRPAVAAPVNGPQLAEVASEPVRRAA
jgi:anti-sigma-K factor RskA